MFFPFKLQLDYNSAAGEPTANHVGGNAARQVGGAKRAACHVGCLAELVTAREC